jgi:GEVED domain/Bacterial Ig domain/Secretion system C-terminal sorting domain
MPTYLHICKRYLLVLSFLCTYQFIHAQSWLTLRDEGANFYDIKAAFNRQYGRKMREMNRELRKEVSKTTVKSDKFERQMEGMVQYMRWANFVEPRVKESNGDLSVMGTSMVQALNDQNRRTATTRAGANWSVIGPINTPTGGGNGRINAVRAHPSVTGTLFACAPVGGLWKSTDSGGSWTPISDAIAVLGATDVAFDPTNASIMYLATGDGDAGDASTTGIYKSTDGGATWAATGLTFATSARLTISKLLVNPTDGSILAGGSVGIYRSTNGGTSWTKVSSTAVRDLEFKPGTPSTVYAGGYGTTAFTRSTDGGATWAATGTGLPTTNWKRVALAVTPLDNTYVYALVSNSADDGFRGLYLSTDGGTSFTAQSSTPNILGWEANGSDAGGQGWYDLSIAVDPSVKTTIYTGGVNIWKSTTSGTSWTCVAHWSGTGAPYAHADNHDLTFIGSTLYAGNDGGVFASANSGSTWTNKSSNLAIAQLYGIGISQTNPNMIISGHQDNGTAYTSNLSTWAEVNGGDGMLCFIDRTNNNTLFSSIYNGDLYRSTNSGGSFSSIYTVPGGGWVTPWLQDPVTATTLYAGGTNVVRSTNTGTSWSTISSFSIGTLVSLDVATTNNQHIVAASASAVMKTTDGGTNWTNITGTLPTGAIQFVYFDPNNASNLYITIASYSGQSVFYSANGGTSWTNISSGLPNVPANCLVIQKNTGDMYCGTDIGVYLRLAGASTWIPFTNGMPGIIVKDLEIYATTGKLRAATYARGIWESTVNSNNSAPSVSITLPANNAIYSLGSNVIINATAADLDGTVSKVEFYQGTTLLGTSITTPYTYTWTTPPLGSYALTAKAYDNLNTITTSSVVNITVAITDDAGISAITTPNGTIYTANSTPSVTLKNFGTTTLTGTTISYKVDNNAWTDYVWTGSLAAGTTTTVTLPTITGYSLAAHTFTAQTGAFNGNTDGNVANNASTSNFTYSLPPACPNTVTSPYSQDFNASTATPTDWTNTSTWLFASNHANGTGNGIYKNLYSSTTTAQFSVVPVGPIGANSFLSFDYRLLNYVAAASYPSNATATALGFGNIQVQISSDCGTTFTTVHTINDANHIVTKNWATKAIPLSTYSTQTIIVRIIANWTTGDWYADLDNFTIRTVTTAPTCATVTAPINNATGQCPTGVTLQWAAVTDATSYDIFTNLPSVSSPINVVGTSYAVAGTLPVNTNFTWQVVPKNSIGSATGCATWNFTTTSSVCYCIPTYVNGCSNGLDVITRLQLGNLDNNTGTECGSGNYNFYSTATVPNLAQSTAQSMTLTFGNDATQFAGAWIDYNQNGTFETTEFLGGNSVTAGGNGVYVLNFTIPPTATLGETRLRVRGGEDVALTSAHGCGASSDTYGQTEDYRVNIIVSSPCSSPLSNTTVASATSVCSGGTVVLSLQNSYTSTGITYQWQSSPDGTTWTNMSGQTTATTTPTVTTATQYRCTLICSGGTPTYSSTIQIAMKSLVNCTCKPSATCTTSFINTVQITSTTLNNANTGCTNSTGNPTSYTQYAVEVATATLIKQTPYSLQVTTSTAQIVSVWIDYNQNGTYETTEWTQVSTATTANVAATVSLTVPVTALAGLTTMRIRSRNSGSTNGAANACTAFTSGETEDYWVTISSSVLPVEMKFVTAYANGEVNRIDWVTASENALKTFIIERSSDSKQWTKINTTEPKGGTQETDYTITDNQPPLLSYYRVRTVNLDGTEETSKIIAVKRYDTKKLALLNVVPVPTTEGVTVDFSVGKETNVALTLTNLMGQVVKTTTIKATEGTNQCVVKMTDLPNGTYFMYVSDGDTKAMKRLVKQ